MEELFKSLSESVSEECYNDIMGIVEELLNEGDNLEKLVVRNINKIKDKTKLKDLKAKASEVPDSKEYEVNKRTEGTLYKHVKELNKSSTSDDPQVQVGNDNIRELTSNNPDALQRIQSIKAIRRHFKKK